MAKVLITGGCGFIGSHIADALLARGDAVVILDDMSTGSLRNIAHIKDRITLIEGSICDPELVKKSMEGVDFVTHQAALASVPRSIDDPVLTNKVNIDGTLNILWSAKQGGVKRVVVASSSSIYGDSEVSPKHEGLPLRPKSPYAFSKVATEEYARIFFEVYGLNTVALRYFNIFGPRQAPDGPYAAVIPVFIECIKKGKRPKINGDGSFSRDFTYVSNAVSANLLAFSAPIESCGTMYNVGAGDQTSILHLYNTICDRLGKSDPPEFGPVRAGDVAHSKADISKIKKGLGYKPLIGFEEGIGLTLAPLR